MFDMHDCHGRSTPLDKTIKLQARAEGEEAFEKERYRQAIGCLLYLAMGSRLDMVYVSRRRITYNADVAGPQKWGKNGEAREGSRMKGCRTPGQGNKGMCWNVRMCGS